VLEQEHTAVGAVCRYMVLSALLSATAVGEEQRMSKIEGTSRHRCQVHVLLAGRMLDPCVERFFGSAANILSPCTSSTTLNMPLQSKSVKQADNVLHHHAGQILEASQGILVVNLAQVASAASYDLLDPMLLFVIA
jgi:hypothetical protein